jgi:hypothetical protein
VVLGDGDFVNEEVPAVGIRDAVVEVGADDGRLRMLLASQSRGHFGESCFSERLVQDIRVSQYMPMGACADPTIEG